MAAPIAAEPDEEIFDIYDEELNHIGTEKRAVVHAKGILHKAVYCYVFNKQGGRRPLHPRSALPLLLLAVFSLHILLLIFIDLLPESKRSFPDKKVREGGLREGRCSRVKHSGPPCSTQGNS